MGEKRMKKTDFWGQKKQQKLAVKGELFIHLLIGKGSYKITVDLDSTGYI